MNTRKFIQSSGRLIIALGFISSAQAVPTAVDLNAWTAESYPP